MIVRIGMTKIVADYVADYVVGSFGFLLVEVCSARMMASFYNIVGFYRYWKVIECFYGFPFLYIFWNHNAINRALLMAVYGMYLYVSILNLSIKILYIKMAFIAFTGGKYQRVHRNVYVVQIH